MVEIGHWLTQLNWGTYYYWMFSRLRVIGLSIKTSFFLTTPLDGILVRADCVRQHNEVAIILGIIYISFFFLSVLSGLSRLGL